MEFPCISCREEVSGRRHALQCDGCARWQHRLCETGMTLCIITAILFFFVPLFIFKTLHHYFIFIFLSSFFIHAMHSFFIHVSVRQPVYIFPLFYSFVRSGYVFVFFRLLYCLSVLSFILFVYMFVCLHQSTCLSCLFFFLCVRSFVRLFTDRACTIQKYFCLFYL